MPALALLTAVTVSGALVAALGWRVLRPGGTETAEVEAAAFDPFGTLGENDRIASRAVDGDPESAWQTEDYPNPDLTSPDNNSKGGVGLALELEARRPVERLEISSPSRGWEAEVYVLDERPTGALDSWPDPVATTDAGGAAAIDLDGTEGGVVILWVTRTADDGQVQVAEAGVVVRR